MSAQVIEFAPRRLRRGEPCGRRPRLDLIQVTPLSAEDLDDIVRRLRRTLAGAIPVASGEVD